MVCIKFEYPKLLQKKVMAQNVFQNLLSFRGALYIIMASFTLEMMKNAKPKEKRGRLSTRSETGRRKEKGSEPATVVLDDDLKIFPYRSVGRLFFKHDKSNGNYVYGSGYVAKLQEGNLKTVITATHNLWDVDCGVLRDFRFIPGMEGMDAYDQTPLDREAFQTFDQINWSPKWNPPTDHDDCYDFGVIEFAPRLSDSKLVGEATPQLVVQWGEAIAKPDDKWTTLAYPVRSDNPQNKMMKQTGAFSRFDRGCTLKEYYGQNLGGSASGGVWMLLDKSGKMVSANGVHVSSDGESSSPTFHKSILPQKYRCD